MKIPKENYLRKMIVLLLAVAMLVVGMLTGTVLAASSNIASGTDWTLVTGGKLTISSDEGMENWRAKRETYKEDVISVEISNGVTSIGVGAFYGCTSLESVTIPVSVTSIGGNVFNGCTSLESVTIPVSVTSIGIYAFNGCKSLKSVTIPEGVTAIENYTFYGCSSLESVTIPVSVTSIGNNAFTGCKSLKSVMIPEGVTTIGISAFHSCESLKSVTIPGSVTSMKEAAFANCSNLTSVEISEGVTDIGPSVFSMCYDLKSVTIPESVTNIGESVFSMCRALKSVTIPEGVTAIKDYTFHECKSLTSVTIPESVTDIGREAFADCSSLTEVTMLRETPPTIGSSLFDWCAFVTDGKKGIHVPVGKAETYKAAWTRWEDYIAEDIASGTGWRLDADGKLTISSDAGMTEWIETINSYKGAVTSVKILDGVTNIGDTAFASCRELTSVTIPDSVLSIGEDAFTGCEKLTNIDIPDSVTSIGMSAFESCISLEEITIPENVTEIGHAALRDCRNLAEVIMLRETPPSIGFYIFDDCKFVTDNKKGICVPTGKADAYKGAWTNWADYIMDNAQMAAEAKTAAADKLKNITVTNATTKEDILSAVNAALSSAGISGVTVTVENFTRTGATTSAAGSIRGTVKITCGNQTETITIDKTIAKLSEAGNEAAKKVAEAKTAAEGALQTIKITNSTTKEDILSAVNAALNSAGISGVTATVEGFTKTEATTSAAGRIRGTVKITCGNQTVTVTINQTIAKLSETGGAGSMTEEDKASVGKLVKELGVSEETAAKILAAAKELDVPMETLLISEDTLKNHKSEGDIKGSTFQKLQAAASKTTTKSVKLIWNKVKGADGYQIYGAKCGKSNKLKLLKDTKKGSTKSYTKKKLKKGTAYKYVVRAYKVIDGKKITIAASKCVHVFTDGGKYGNTKSIKVKKIKKSKVTLKKGKTYKLKASEVKAKKALKRHRKLCYESSNKKVATVTSKGVIRAKAKGTCTVYVYAQNGKQKKIKVTVK